MVDSGGEDGVTANAYAWYRRIRRLGLQDRVVISKGIGGRADWTIRETMIGNKQGQGDVPLHLFHADKFKDMVQNGLDRTLPGPGYYHFPTPRGPLNPNGWITQAFFDELLAEVRQEDGTWKQIKPRNETRDLCSMILLGCALLGVDRRREFWSSPPAWALLVTDPAHADIVTPEIRRAEKEAVAGAVAAAKPEGRRVRPSSYMQG